MRLLKSLREGIRRRWLFCKAWVRDGTPLWMWLAVAAILFGIPYYFPAAFLGVAVELGDRVRWSGMLFQFAGLAKVVVGLNLSRQVFDQSSLWKAVVQWLGRARYMVVPPKPIHAEMNVKAGVGMVAGGAVTVATSGGASIEDRVAKLEADLQQFEGKLSEIRNDVRELRSETKKRIDQERAERITEDRKIGTRLETATIGGIHLEVAGVVYLFFGIAMAAVPEEAASMLRAIGL